MRRVVPGIGHADDVRVARLPPASGDEPLDDLAELHGGHGVPRHRGAARAVTSNAAWSRDLISSVGRQSVLARAVAVTAAAAAALTIGVTTANAQTVASNPYTDTGVCGSGYGRIDHHDLPHATIYLDYNGSTNCVVTIKNVNIGTPTEAWLFRQSDFGGGDDLGNFSYFAGPERIAAPGVCVEWGGSDDTGVSWNSGWSHCG